MTNSEKIIQELKLIIKEIESGHSDYCFYSSIIGKKNGVVEYFQVGQPMESTKELDYYKYIDDNQNMRAIGTPRNVSIN